jgi:hypothetical protein
MKMATSVAIFLVQGAGKRMQAFRHAVPRLLRRQAAGIEGARPEARGFSLIPDS